MNSAGEAANREVNEREGRKQKGTKCCDVIHSEALQLNQRDGEYYYDLESVLGLPDSQELICLAN